MFDALTDRLEGVFKRIRGQARLTEDNIGEALREVRLALLEADVNFKVVKDFVERVREKAVGEDVLKSLSPGQQVVKVVHAELVDLLGGANAELELKARPATLMMVGLQGSGKTTSTAKLALWLTKKGKKPYLVPADVYRPAAIDQLTVLAKSLSLPVHPSTTRQNPVDIAREAVDAAKAQGCDVVLIDTAGRLAIDEPLMDELANIKAAVNPAEVLFVADAMIGQDAVTTATAFNEKIPLTGVVLTKMDGDARGGAALSIKAVTGTPVKFVGVGEKPSDFEPFHPERAAGRILGMGDVLTLIEKAQSATDAEEAAAMEAKLRKATFDLDDFRSQMKKLKMLGSIEGLLKMIPGMGALSKQLGGLKMPEKELAKVEAMINSMTKEERAKPEIINASRQRRIARGSGAKPEEVGQLLTQFSQMRNMMQTLMGGGGKGFRMPKGFSPQGAHPGLGMAGAAAARGLTANRDKERDKRKKDKKKRKKKR